jgi:nicotinamide mononucleotide transporter
MDMNRLVETVAAQTTLPEVIAVLFGLTCVWFMKKESVLAFPFGIVNVLIYVYIFFTAGLFANASINAYFFLMSLYGWFTWSRRDGNEPALKIGRCSKTELILNALAIAGLFVIIRLVLVRFTESRVPEWDAATTAVYMVAQWLLSRKKIENWILWISADVVMIGLCAWEGLYFSSFQYLVFTLIAILGFREWRMKLIG